MAVGLSPGQAALLVWLAWGLSWLAAAPWSDKSARRMLGRRENLYRVIHVVGILLLFGIIGPDHGLWQAGAGWPWVGVAFTALGFLFCWWARLHLGRLWSANVARKAAHRVIDSGPYRVVRHPIYSGIILAGFATAFTRGTVAAALGAVLLAFSWYLKARLEEQFLRAELGAAYDAYAARTKMLVPFIF